MQTFQKNAGRVFMLTMAAFFWGTTFVAQKIAGSFQGAFTFCCIRNLLAALILTPLVFLYERKSAGGSLNENQEQANAEKKLLIQGGTLTGIFLAGTAIFQQLGLQMGTGAGKAGFLTSCYIILVPVIGIFFHKKCRYILWLWVLLAIAGLYLLCMDERLHISLQDVFILICSLACALQITTVDYFAPKVKNPIRLARAEFLVCGIICAIPMVFVEIGFSAVQFSAWAETLSGMRAWLPLLYAAVFSNGVAYTLQIFGQKGLNSTVASLVMSLESVFAVLAAVIVLQEQMSGREAIGCVLVFAAVIFSQIFG